ncbi:MAG: hypothetical protein NTW96_11710 [Planctomycetia bacterium]|nr:hypothetical protein [Planctomycetia bacterium]
MNLQSVRELEVTREKLQMLEDQYEATRTKPSPDEHVRELALLSLKKLINQLKEEIARFEAHMVKPAQSG